MPTLNYENAGALVEYDYLQGTITALYPDDDTADVSGVCGTLSKVPIFYHCKPDSAARSNGALTGAAGAFTVGDVVVVLKGIDGSDRLGQKYYVVGRYDGVKRCGGEGCVFIYSGEHIYIYPSYIDYVYQGFVWDLATDDYAVDVYIPQYGRVIERNDWPVPTNHIAMGYFETWAASRFYMIPFTPTRIVESQNIFTCTNYDFGMARAKVGDYVYNSVKPWIWSKVKVVAGCMIQTEDQVVTGSLPTNWVVSSSLPLFYAAQEWTYRGSTWPPQTPDGSELCYVPIYSPDGEFMIAFEVNSPEFNINMESMGGYHNDYVNNTNVVESLPGSGNQRLELLDYACGYVCENADQSTDVFAMGWDNSGVGWQRYVCGASGHTLSTYLIDKALKAEFKGNFGGDYWRNWVDEYSEIWECAGAYGTYSPITMYIRTYIYRIYGTLNPLDSTDYGYRTSIQTTPPPEIRHDSGDTNRVSGEFAVCSDDFCVQFYTYRGYERNTVAQCSKRPSPTSAPDTSRSSKFEAAIKHLISESIDQNDNFWNLKIYGRYYSGTRDVSVVGTDMIAMLNAVRGYPEPLTEDVWCMGSSEAQVAFWLADECAQHTNPDGSPLTFVGMEVLAVALDTVPISDILASWMASPHHAEAIMEMPYKVAGYASGTYSSSTTQIRFGPGMYNAIDEIYTTEETTQSIPLEYRGHVKCYVVRMTP